MSRKRPSPSTDKIVLTFDAWLKNNHDELSKDNPSHLLSIIEDKWRGLITEYLDDLLIEYRLVIDDIRLHTYPEGKE